jgi:beta-xylosidase
MNYTNPVYAGYFADPFVFRHAGEYFAIGTGADEARGESVSSARPSIFPLLRSRDLVHWEELGPALIAPAGERESARGQHAQLGSTFWAPEIAHAEGRWYLYYSVGHGDARHQLRVAVGERPAGPYRDAAALTDPLRVPFAIDPHPFRDDDGKWYLFQARDFLDVAQDHSHRAGTALVVHELETMTQLAEAGHTVLRARCDWQRFRAERPMYGGTFDWHTLEGPCVLKHAGLYYCLYSGGCWEDESYGVDYAVARHPLGPYDDQGNQAGPRVLRSVPGKVTGPGHCSVVRAPDEASYVIVYHAWNRGMTARSMCIDELSFGPEGPRSSGPSWTERALGNRARS